LPDIIDFEEETVSVYIGLGSNLGDRAGNLLQAIYWLLAEGLEVKRLSSIYETEPVEYLEQPRFLNMVARLEGSLPSPEELLHKMLEIEQKMGRKRSMSKGPRTIDLDLLIYRETVMSNSSLTVPHPEISNRAFVLLPLLEIAPDLIHPLTKRPLREDLIGLANEQGVTLWRPV
jgi:2-amino-4-hydroxy-6-hydroxymethyldihydropteridine diphosphokinase